MVTPKEKGTPHPTRTPNHPKGPITVLTNLRKLRHERQMTLQELSEKTQITPSGLSLLERGKRVSYLPTALNVAKALGVSVEQLVEPQEEDDA